ncbi:MAG: HD-GYP domain-containing protein [Planctomycetota bacterium]|nr:HD-GYP domain-containing protein [Planctomycetota bacterium]
MAQSYDEVDRASSELVVLHDVLSWREFHEVALRRAGFGQVATYPAQPDALQEHFNQSPNRHVDLIVFGVQPQSEMSWENLRQLRGVFSGPVLATTELQDDKAQERVRALGIQDYLAVGEFGEEALELKVETALTAHRINTMILENDLRTQRLFVNILTVMVRILESKDPYTRFHSHAVAKWSRMIGRRKGLCEEDLDRLGLAAVFHDFGKIGVPEAILNKAGALTDEEFAVMRKHPTIARDLLSSLELLSDLLPAIAHHHERWDGSGYPDGLKGEQTPLWGRIIALADAYDTMVTRRTYKDPMAMADVRVELDRCRGTQFEADLVDHFKAILDEYVKVV